MAESIVPDVMKGVVKGDIRALSGSWTVIYICSHIVKAKRNRTLVDIIFQRVTQIKCKIAVG